MAYVIAAYAVTIGTLAVYLVHLVVQRRSLVRELQALSSPGRPSPRDAPSR